MLVKHIKNKYKRVKGIEKLDIKRNLRTISLKMCFKLAHALCGMQIFW